MPGESAKEVVRVICPSCLKCWDVPTIEPDNIPTDLHCLDCFVGNTQAELRRADEMKQDASEG